MKSRRNFLKLVSGGAVASLFAGRTLAANGSELPEKKKPPVKKREKIPTTGLKILRLTQPVSTWSRDKLITPGHLFTHDYGAKEGQDLGSELKIDRIEYVGMKAMQFKSNEIGTLPVGVFTDLQSPEFQAIVEASKNRDIFGCMWGPVYKLTHKGQQFELFCGNPSMRRFAVEELDGPNTIENVWLSSKLVSNRYARWYVPVITRI